MAKRTQPIRHHPQIDAKPKSEFNLSKVLNEKKIANRIMDYKYLEFGQKGTASSFLVASNHLKTEPLKSVSESKPPSLKLTKIER
jgi:hypothetical protein